MGALDAKKNGKKRRVDVHLRSYCVKDAPQADQAKDFREAARSAGVDPDTARRHWVRLEMAFQRAECRLLMRPQNTWSQTVDGVRFGNPGKGFAVFAASGLDVLTHAVPAMQAHRKAKVPLAKYHRS